MGFRRFKVVRQQPCPRTASPGAPGEPGGRAGLLHALVLWPLCGPHRPSPSAWGGTGRGQAAGGARTDRAGDMPGAARGQGSQVGGRVTWGPGQWLHKRCTEVLENIKKRCGQMVQGLPRWHQGKRTSLPGAGDPLPGSNPLAFLASGFQASVSPLAPIAPPRGWCGTRVAPLLGGSLYK